MIFSQRTISKSSDLLEFESKLSSRREGWRKQQSMHQLSIDSKALKNSTTRRKRGSVISDSCEYMGQIEETIEDARLVLADVSVLRFRIDQAEEISTTYGDACLTKLEEMIASTLINQAQTGMIGWLEDGDLVYHSSEGTIQDNARLGEKFRQTVNKKVWQVDGILFEVSATFALVQMSSLTATAKDLLKRAETTLMQAQEFGPNRIEVYGSWFAVA